MGRRPSIECPLERLPVATIQSQKIVEFPTVRTGCESIFRDQGIDLRVTLEGEQRVDVESPDAPLWKHFRSGSSYVLAERLGGATGTHQHVGVMG